MAHWNGPFNQKSLMPELIGVAIRLGISRARMDSGAQKFSHRH
jgi:hypothetical protein